MKKLFFYFPLFAVATILLTGCPKNGNGTGDGIDTTKHDSIVKPPAHDYGAAVITLERTVCFGNCPAYTLTINGNGKVVYEGRRFVQVTGTQSVQIDAAAVKGLVDEFFKIDYFALPDSFTSNIEDVPSTITSLTIDGKSKTVFENDGAPKALKDLEARIDSVTNSAQWVSMPPER